MAMPNGNFVTSDKMQFQSGGGGAVGGEIHHPRPWFPDERDGFISWLRAELAAANAILVSLCQHLTAVNDPGEYDPVVGYINQRKGSWYPIITVQQFFPISDIQLALQKVSWRRQQRSFKQSRVGGKEFKKPGAFNGFESRKEQMAEATKELGNLGVDNRKQNVNAFVPGSLEKRGAVKEKAVAETGNGARKFARKSVLDVQNVTGEAFTLLMEFDEAGAIDQPILGSDAGLVTKALPVAPEAGPSVKKDGPDSPPSKYGAKRKARESLKYEGSKCSKRKDKQQMVETPLPAGAQLVKLEDLFVSPEEARSNLDNFSPIPPALRAIFDEAPSRGQLWSLFAQLGQLVTLGTSPGQRQLKEANDRAQSKDQELKIVRTKVELAEWSLQDKEAELSVVTRELNSLQFQYKQLEGKWNHAQQMYTAGRAVQSFIGTRRFTNRVDYYSGYRYGLLDLMYRTQLKRQGINFKLNLKDTCGFPADPPEAYAPPALGTFTDDGEHPVEAWEPVPLNRSNTLPPDGKAKLQNPVAVFRNAYAAL